MQPSNFKARTSCGWGGDFVALFVHFDLPKHQSVLPRPGAHQVDGTFAFRPVMTAPQGLPIDRDDLPFEGLPQIGTSSCGNTRQTAPDQGGQDWRNVSWLGISLGKAKKRASQTSLEMPKSSKSTKLWPRRAWHRGRSGGDRQGDGSGAIDAGIDQAREVESDRGMGRDRASQEFFSEVY